MISGSPIAGSTCVTGGAVVGRCNATTAPHCADTYATPTRSAHSSACAAQPHRNRCHEPKHPMQTHVRQRGERAHARPPHRDTPLVLRRAALRVELRAAQVVHDDGGVGEARQERGGGLQLEPVHMEVEREAVRREQREAARSGAREVTGRMFGLGGARCDRERETSNRRVWTTHLRSNAGTPPVRKSPRSTCGHVSDGSCKALRGTLDGAA